MLEHEHRHFMIDGARIVYAIRRSQRRRRTIGLTIGRDGDIRVLAPTRTTTTMVEDFLGRHIPWLRRRLKEYQRRKSAVADRRYRNGEKVLFRGNSYDLLVTKDQTRPQGCALEGTQLTINLHGSDLDARDLDDPGLQGEEARLELSLWYKRQARRIFKERLDYWSQRLNLTYRSFTVSNPRRLWGSCSGKNDIRINWRLIMASPDLLDYVVVHELSHISHKNHSSAFWRQVQSALPESKVLRKRLRITGADLAF